MKSFYFNSEKSSAVRELNANKKSINCCGSFEKLEFPKHMGVFAG